MLTSLTTRDRCNSRCKPILCYKLLLLLYCLWEALFGATLPVSSALSTLDSLNSHFPKPSQAFTTKSGYPVCRYALGGAARSSQPESLPFSYYQYLVDADANANHDIDNNNPFPYGAPFYFYYNPQRYPAFMAGIQKLCSSNKQPVNSANRQDLFIASGGTSRGTSAMEQRLKEALEKCGGDYLDAFMLEYVCPYEIIIQTTTGNNNNKCSELQDAIDQAQNWKKQGLVRYVGATTHSHKVGAILAENKGIDIVMLRYNMAHKKAAEALSFPACVQSNKPVITFTTTRWNGLQKGHEEWKDTPPTTGDCLSFALSTTVAPPVEIVLHSARTEEELKEALQGVRGHTMDAQKTSNWRAYGDLEWNAKDAFDEYPEEQEAVNSS